MARLTTQTTTAFADLAALLLLGSWSLRGPRGAWRRWAGLPQLHEPLATSGDAGRLGWPAWAGSGLPQQPLQPTAAPSRPPGGLRGSAPTGATTSRATASTSNPAEELELPSAMCIVGNIRTFPLTFDSIERFAVENGLHAYMVLQLGRLQASTWLVYQSFYFGRDIEARLVQELQARVGRRPLPGQMDVRRVEVTSSGSCAEYSQRYAPLERRFPSHCLETPTHAQVRWIRTCFSMVLDAKVRYRLIVRTRPDVAFFGSIHLAKYSSRDRPPYALRVLWKPGSPEVGGDWFFFLSYTGLPGWWRTVEDQAMRNTGFWPYFDYFAFRGTGRSCLHFPVAILRSSRLAECCRLGQWGGSQPNVVRPGYPGLSPGSASGQALEGSCSRALERGSFSRLASFLPENSSAAAWRLPGQAYRFCNADHPQR